jgi:H+/Cl- antiporter ClcA
MREQIREETVLFISVIKWIIFATAVGLIVGFSTSLFLKILTWSANVTGKYSYFFVLLPIALFISVMLTKYLAPDAEGHGTEKVIEAVHKTSGRIKAMVVPVKLAATIVTLAFGGSVGKEGPCAQIGAGLSSIFADFFKLSDKDRRKLVICGISAGFASVFGTPVGGAIFGVEVLFVGTILYDVLLPSFIAGITSYQISTALGVHYFYHPVNFVPVFSEAFFAKVILAGIFFGLCSAVMIEILNLGQKVARKIKIWDPWKGVIGGIIIIPLVFIFSRDYLGLGLDSIESALNGTRVAWHAFLTKSVFTSITLNFGGSGGIVTPIFFVGTAAGSLFGQLLHLDPATFAAMGMVSVLAGCANTPVSASIMSVELFGPKLAPYATVSCVISFLMTGHRSVYPSQVLAVRKSPSIDFEMGHVMENLETRVRIRDKTLLAILKFLKNTTYKIEKFLEKTGVIDKNKDRDDDTYLE